MDLYQKGQADLIQHIKDNLKYLADTPESHITDFIVFLTNLRAKENPNQPTVTEWISVDDRLPDAYKTVLLCTDNVSFAGFYCDKDDAWTDLEECEWAYITHWQPLPEPPNNQ